MFNSLRFFASEADGPVVHVAPNHIFTIGSLQVTNSMLYGLIISLLMVVGLIYLARKVTVRPKGGVVQFVEAMVTFVSDLVEGAFDNKSVGRKYVPFFVTLFFFILIHNWSGLIPGVGEAIQLNGEPLLRAMTADLNTTLAIGLIAMGVVYVAAIREVGGIGKYIRHFFIGSPLNPLYLVIGLIEMITDLTRALSLALRLFLNMTIGEIVIAVFAYLGTLLAPASVLAPITALPFTLLELGVGALQAYIFVILAVNYLAITVNSAHSHASAADLTEDETPETIKAIAAKA
ncbi:MAG: synthase subunit [Candidatus Saccharibacteria bacterium]|nr:synthase subunit [Candidatus Saccharibacteria bacterium]